LLNNLFANLDIPGLFYLHIQQEWTQEFLVDEIHVKAREGILQMEKDSTDSTEFFKDLISNYKEFLPKKPKKITNKEFINSLISNNGLIWPFFLKKAANFDIIFPQDHPYMKSIGNYPGVKKSLGELPAIEFLRVIMFYKVFPPFVENEEQENSIFWKNWQLFWNENIDPIF